MAPRHSRAGLAFLGLAVAVAFLGLPALGAVPNPEFSLNVDTTQDARTITYTIHFDNIGAASSVRVTITDNFPAEATYLGDSADLVEGIWTRTYDNVTTGPHEVSLSARLSESVEDGTRVTNLVVLRYTDAKGAWIEKSFETEFAVAFAPLAVTGSPGSSFPVWLAAPSVAAIVLGAVVARRPRKAKIEQVFLMHSSGMLIHHWAATASPARDIDIMSGMFMIMKEFVRDSFRPKKGGLTELQFGESRMFLAEGRHSVLAAVANGPRVNGLPGEIAAAVEDFERTNGGALEGWTGRLDQFPGAKTVVDGLVRGRYRNWRLT